MAKYRLPEGVKKAWVQALRSGEYNQTKGHLKDAAGHCCLGVLVECAGEFSGPPLGESRIMRQHGMWSADVCDPGEAGDLSLPIGVQSVLQQMNDSGGKTFDEIADYIEKNL